ncbi:MAG: tRNA (N(6)-L-threonylcarbamoyladenosine(37)-C(2))-methylthiotransferase MtaB [candidate division Zixibacteria bacterium]|nr:tRNA (N(6)-L-threonylcarbamoyladenosine(37)-C(2))-methylthiotransferase MtaB [candidate division Zixibacteria bacterium]
MTAFSPKKVSFQTVGCRLNQYETERMAADLAACGFQRATRGEVADLYVINTCTVTHRADKDCRYLIRKACRENPEGRIVVVGCFVEVDPSGTARMEGVDVVIRNNEKERLAEILPQRLPELFNGCPSRREPAELTDFFQRNRAWIKVSDGCNQVCSYCLVTIVRGDLVCRPCREIVAEVNCLVANGYREIVLTGVNVGCYCDSSLVPAVSSFADLCRRILAETDIYRLRLSSLEPQTVTDELLDVFVQSRGRICRHWHIPLQSGSSRILKLMRRPYDRDMYAAKLSAIKQAVPNTIIGADVIVGFPGETEEDFDQSRSLTESGLVDYLHVFSYSDRAGTAAAEMPGKNHPQVIKVRNSELTSISNQLRFRAHQRQIGNILEVIPEFRKTTDGHYRGISDNYLRVKLPHGVAGGKEILKTRITAAHPEYLECEIVS